MKIFMRCTCGAIFRFDASSGMGPVKDGVHRVEGWIDRWNALHDACTIGENALRHVETQRRMPKAP